MPPNSIYCPSCYAAQPTRTSTGPSSYNPPVGVSTGKSKDRKTAGILALLLGGLGVHKFYLGQIWMGVLYLLFVWTYIPAIIGIIEGIMYLNMSDYDFEQKYVNKL